MTKNEAGHDGAANTEDVDSDGAADVAAAAAAADADDAADAADADDDDHHHVSFL